MLSARLVISSVCLISHDPPADVPTSRSCHSGHWRSIRFSTYGRWAHETASHGPHWVGPLRHLARLVAALRDALQISAPSASDPRQRIADATAPIPHSYFFVRTTRMAEPMLSERRCTPAPTTVPRLLEVAHPHLEWSAHLHTLIAILFSSKDAALEGVRALHALEVSGDIEIETVHVIRKDQSGAVTQVREDDDFPPPSGTLAGLALGTTVGVLGGGAGAAIGAGVGGMLGMLRDLYESKSLTGSLAEVANALVPGGMRFSSRERGIEPQQSTNG